MIFPPKRRSRGDFLTPSPDRKRTKFVDTFYDDHLVILTRQDYEIDGTRGGFYIWCGNGYWKGLEKRLPFERLASRGYLRDARLVYYKDYKFEIDMSIKSIKAVRTSIVTYTLYARYEFSRNVDIVDHMIKNPRARIGNVVETL